MKTTSRKWVIHETVPEDKKQLYEQRSSVVAQLLFNRGLRTPDAIATFLHPDYERDILDPFLFTHMRTVVTRILQAIDKQERVVVYGDYDADGVCSATLLEEALRAYGLKNVSVYLPHREKEGYGLNIKAVEFLVQNPLDLLITVDCGSTNVQEVATLKKYNVDVIVLDHHTEQDNKPDALAIINPKFHDAGYPFREFASAGVVYKVVQALVATRELAPSWEKWQLDIVAIATIADLMALTGENRALVKYGLIVLNKTRRIGLLELIRAMGKYGKEIGPYEIGFMIGPRLNAAGRMDHANAAYSLLMEQDERKAAELASDLNQTNHERQELTMNIFKAADEIVRKKLNKKVLVAVQPKESALPWTAGIIGLVAGKITQKYQRPALVIGRAVKGLVGSGRSISFNIIEAIKKSPELFINFGGHAQACGFTLKDEAGAEALELRINEIADKELTRESLSFVSELAIDMEIPFACVDIALWEDVKQFQPFGQQNSEPVFIASGLTVCDCRVVGVDEAHVRLTLEKEGVQKNAIGFGFAHIAAWCHPGTIIDLAFSLQHNIWNRSEYVDLRIVDIRKETKSA